MVVLGKTACTHSVSTFTRLHPFQGQVVSYLYSRGHCCLLCEVEGKNLKLPLRIRTFNNLRWRPPRHEATFPLLVSCYIRGINTCMNLTTTSKGDIKKAKHYKNVIGSCFINIPLAQVSLYYNTRRCHSYRIYSHGCNHRSKTLTRSFWDLITDHPDFWGFD